MSALPWYKWYPDHRGRAAMATMSIEEEWSYHRLLEYAWTNGAIPNDSKKLRRILQLLNTRTFNLCLSVILPLFTLLPDGSGYVDDDQELQRQEALRRKETDTKRAKTAASARWSEHSSEHAPSTPPSTPPSNAPGMLTSREIGKIPFLPVPLEPPVGETEHTNTSSLQTPSTSAARAEKNNSASLPLHPTLPLTPVNGWISTSNTPRSLAALTKLTVTDDPPESPESPKSPPVSPEKPMPPLQTDRYRPATEAEIARYEAEMRRLTKSGLR